MYFIYFYLQNCFFFYYVEQAYIPLLPWTDVFKKAIYMWNEKVAKEVTAIQNENMLLQWKTKMDPKQVI